MLRWKNQQRRSEQTSSRRLNECVVSIINSTCELIALQISELEHVVQQHRESRIKLIDSFKARLEKMKTENGVKVADLQNQLQAITAERDQLAASSTASTDSSEKIVQLTSELELARKALEDEKSRQVEPILAPSVEVSDYESRIVRRYINSMTVVSSNYYNRMHLQKSATC
jgi:septal ring factor EnvC (AmiA/AmiB activator)